MGVQWPEESFYFKEMRKWDAPKRDGGMNRNGFEEYPKMLYKTQPNPLSGRHEVSIHADVLSLDKTTVILDAQQFNATCQTTVGDRNEEERYIRAGWRTSQAEAVQYHEDELSRVAIEAAQRNSDDFRMSEKAKAEAAKADAATPNHLPEVKEQPRVLKPMSADAGPSVALDEMALQDAKKREETRQKRAAAMAKARAAKAAKKNETPAV